MVLSGVVLPSHSFSPFQGKEMARLISTLLFFTWSFLMAGDVRFEEVSLQVGIEFSRTASKRLEIWEAIKAQEHIKLPEDIHARPLKNYGIAGVALFDFDNDGDLDIYAPNGPGEPNSLYSNQLIETGSMTFIDVAVEAGVTARQQDSSGVVFGDIDNDGDHDLYVLGAAAEPNILFMNRGDGTFSDITAASGAGGGNKWSASAAMGDVNGDGLLDIYVGNTGDLGSNHIIFTEIYALCEHNQLFINKGNNRFEEMGSELGLHDTQGISEPGQPGLTWAVGMVDYDLDGDLDIFSADDQGGFLPAVAGGFERGVMHLFRNDGQGRFTDVAVEAGIAVSGGYMGLTFGDYNHDGSIDFFVSNLGSYNVTNLDLETNNAMFASKWFLGNGSGGFTYPGLTGVKATPFGWGAGSADYDNDGDTDIIFYGGIDFGELIMMSNPGSVLSNNGEAHFDYDGKALAGSVNHTQREVQGMALGDLDGNGFVDIVTVSGFDIPDHAPFKNWRSLGGQMDGIPQYIETIVPGQTFGSQIYRPDIPEYLKGSLRVEMNGGNTHGHVTFKLIGGAGIASEGKVNRDAIGAVVYWTPEGGKTAIHPVTGGSSFASQHSLDVNLGMGGAVRGRVEVLWPGGVRTLLEDVASGETLVLPELPLSHDQNDCGSIRRIKTALSEFEVAGYLSSDQSTRILHSITSSSEIDCANHDFEKPERKERIKPRQ